MHKNIILFILFYSTSVLSQSDTVVKKYYNYQNKLTQEGKKIDDKRIGEWRFYDDSLFYLYKIENYKNNYPDGLFMEFNSEGVMILKGYHSIKAIKHYKEKDTIVGGVLHYYKSLPVGELLYYNNEGKLMKKETYSKKGKLKKTEKPVVADVHP